MIEIIDLTKRYGRFSLEMGRLQVKEGEIYGIVGRNGVGKTTLLRLLFRLIEPESGSILYDGVDIFQDESIKERGELRAYLNEKFLIPFLTPLEFLEVSARLLKVSQSDFSRQLKRYGEFLPDGYEGKSKLIRELSSGNRVRLGVVGAILNDPGVLLLDEPFAYLDPTSKKQLAGILTDMNRKSGTTIIVSSHDLESVASVCSRIGVMENGVIIQEEVTSDGIRRNLHSYF